MDELALRQGTLPAQIQKRVQQELARQTGSIQGIAQVAEVAMDAVSDIHGYAQYKVATTLAAAQIIQEAGAGSTGRTSLGDTAHHHLTKAYLEHMGHITEVASHKIIREVAEFEVNSSTGIKGWLTRP